MTLEVQTTRPRLRPAAIGAILLAILAIVAVGYWLSASLAIAPAGTAERTYSVQFWESVEPTVDAADFSPDEVPDFEIIEAKCIELTPKVQPAVVGVFSPSAAVLPRSGPHLAGASGVVISADGLVLSQFHVSHAHHGDVLDFAKYDKPGEEGLVVFADGAERKANLLGASIDHDLSLLQLCEPGPYPFVEFNADAMVNAGDWVVKLGHPGGFRQDRLAPLRLGRVLLSTHDLFVTDCPITGGDSGGPFFDLAGRLVGIVNGSGAANFMLRLFGEKTFNANSSTLPMFVIGAPRIASLMERMKRGEIINHSRETGAALCGGVRLRPDQWTQSRNYKSVFEPITAPLRESVVTILNGSVPVALGTVVDEDGLAVVKASVLPPVPRCRLPDNRIVDLNIIGIDMAFDLAVVRLPPESVRPVAWSQGESPPVGRIVLTVGPEGRALSVGVVSVALRQVDNHQEPRYDLPLRLKADRPPIYGQVADGKYVANAVLGLAKSSGILPGDRLHSVAGRRIALDEDVAKAVDGKLSGDVVPVVVVRDGKAFSFDLPLLPAVKVGAWNRTWRHDDFPIAFEYSPPVATTECGGPIVDRSGRVVGVTVGQTTDACGWAIPADKVRRIVDDARKGELMQWPQR